MDRDMSESTMPGENRSTQYSGQESIASALATKRSQLDQDVAEYRAHKDEEYRTYERRLRKEHARSKQSNERGQMQDENATQSPSKRSSAKTKPRRERRESSDNDLSSPKRPEATLQPDGPPFGGSPGPPTEPQKENGHRGGEWEGVFTPEYLPLIDGHSQNPTLSLTPILATPLSIQLSSSASPRNHSHSLTLTPQPHPLSSSAPPHSPTMTQHPHHQRSDSSNSVLSVGSLRSSMKDRGAKGAGVKSPKRVLFSMGEGVVVSPSSSPVVTRQNWVSGEGEEGAMEGVMELGKRTQRRDGSKKKVRRRERGGSRDDSERGRSTGEDEDTGRSDVVPGTKVAGSLTKNSLPERPATNGNVALSAYVSPPEDFEKVESSDGEELFTFDEDMDAVERAKGRLSKETPDVGFEDEEEGGEKVLVAGTSPHAGSLPIEIKWPQRREGSGSLG